MPKKPIVERKRALYPNGITDSLIRQVLRLYKTHQLKDVAKKLGIKMTTARYIAFDLNPEKRTKKDRPSPIDKESFENFMKKNTKWKDLIKKFGISKKIITNFFLKTYNTQYIGRVKYMLGLEEIIFGVPFEKWEDDYIIKNYEKLGATQVGRDLGRTSESVYARYLRVIGVKNLEEKKKTK